jgi:hypothetical protein
MVIHIVILTIQTMKQKLQFKIILEKDKKY